MPKPKPPQAKAKASPKARSHLAVWGNSLGLRLPKTVLDAAGLAQGSPVEITVVRGVIRIQPHVTPSSESPTPDLPQGPTLEETKKRG
jgi:hypothetical protein